MTKPGSEASRELLVPLDATFPNLAPGTVHSKCVVEKGDQYPDRNLRGAIPWSEPDPGYQPTPFTHPVVARGPAWADPPDPAAAGRTFQSYEGKVLFGADGITPRNPRGRTGVSGRGLLGRWGVNFAADPICTRVHPTTGKLEMIAILRKDCEQWAIPGGMADYGEPVSGTLARELAEEALGKEASPEEIRVKESFFRHLFESQGRPVYAGYVDDPRNTDDAWLETNAVHLHLTGQDAEIELVAGDDAKKVQWMELNEEHLAALYASHGDFVRKALLEWQLAHHKRILADGTVLDA